MPTYDYACGACGGFEQLRRIAERDAPAACPTCGEAARRVVAGMPGLALMDGTVRSALATNERARHEPRRSGETTRLRHPAGCGCCSTGRKATVQAANGNKAFPSKRPWMISH